MTGTVKTIDEICQHMPLCSHLQAGKVVDLLVPSGVLPKVFCGLVGSSCSKREEFCPSELAVVGRSSRTTWLIFLSRKTFAGAFGLFVVELVLILATIECGVETHSRTWRDYMGEDVD